MYNLCLNSTKIHKGQVNMFTGGQLDLKKGQINMSTGGEIDEGVKS
jgi:hypothetical protein